MELFARGRQASHILHPASLIPTGAAAVWAALPRWTPGCHCLGFNP